MSSARRTGSACSRHRSNASASSPPTPARLTEHGRFGEVEALLVGIGAGEYLAQVFGGIPMNQGEMVRPADLYLEERDVEGARTSACAG